MPKSRKRLIKVSQLSAPLKPDLLMSSTFRRQGQKVKVVNTNHAHVSIGQIGTIEEVYTDGFCIRFETTTKSKALGGGQEGASVFMGLGDVVDAPVEQKAEIATDDPPCSPAAAGG
jgi:hypothetical protein